MKRKTIDYLELKSLVSDICRQITLSKWRPDYIVGITRGGLIPAVMMSHYFNIPMYALHVSLRDNSDNNESNLWMAEDAYGYNSAAKNILIVDDINDSGNTINWIMEDWKNSCLPNSDTWNNVWNNNVRFATIVDNLESKSLVKMDYVGIEIIDKTEQDIWVDFPYEQWWK